MTFNTWKEEFYPIDAEEAITSDLTAINHSLIKWKGALKKNVERHGVVYSNFGIESPTNTNDSEYLEFSGESCALCQRYKSRELKCYSKELGTVCPIVRYSGATCDDNNNSANEPILSTWIRSRNNPQPMIDLLTKTRKFILNEEKE